MKLADIVSQKQDHF